MTNDFDFVSDYAETEEKRAALEDNTAESAISCAFVGIGGGGGKLAKAFFDLGFRKILLINTTSKDFEKGLGEQNYLPLPGLDGVGKNIDLGIKVLSDNSTLIEDTLRTRFGKVDWLFVCACGGGGTGSSAGALHDAFLRYLQSVEGSGGIVYIITKPSAQELLNTTIHANFHTLHSSLRDRAYVLLDNERQLTHMRGKVGVAKLYPRINEMFAKLFWNLLKFAAKDSEIAVFDSKDLSQFLSAPGRILLGTALLTPAANLGADMYQKCIDNSPCPSPENKAKVGVLLEVIAKQSAEDPEVGGHLEAAASYVGSRSDTLFTGIYVLDLPENLQSKIVSVLALGGLAPWTQKTVGQDSPMKSYP